MKTHIALIGLFLAVSCGTKKKASENTESQPAPTPTPCDTILERSCAIRDGKKCLAYDTKEISVCAEGK